MCVGHSDFIAKYSAHELAGGSQLDIASDRIVHLVQKVSECGLNIMNNTPLFPGANYLQPKGTPFNTWI